MSCCFAFDTFQRKTSDEPVDGLSLDTSCETLSPSQSIRVAHRECQQISPPEPPRSFSTHHDQLCTAKRPWCNFRDKFLALDRDRDGHVRRGRSEPCKDWNRSLAFLPSARRQFRVLHSVEIEKCINNTVLNRTFIRPVQKS